MKQKGKYFLLLLIVIIPATIAYFKINIKTVNADDPMKKYGYEISVISYNGSGEPSIVGSPILVYQPGLLDPVTKTISGYYPRGTGNDAYKQLLNTEYGLVQFVQENNPNTTVQSDEIMGFMARIGAAFESGDPTLKAKLDSAAGVNNRSDELSTEHKGVIGFLKDTYLLSTFSIFVGATSASFESYGIDIVDAYQQKIDINENIIKNSLDVLRSAVSSTTEKWDAADKITAAQLDNKQLNGEKLAFSAVIDAGDGTKHNEYEKLNIVGKGCIYRAREKTTGQANINKDIRRYMSSERTVIYNKDMINLSRYCKIIEDTGTAEEMAVKYAGSVELIKENFNIDINPMDLDKYYIQVEVVQRALEYDASKQITIGRQMVHTITNKVLEPSKWEAGGSGWVDDYPACPDGYILSKDQTFCYNCSCPEGYTCSGESCSYTTSSSYTQCKSSCSTGETTGNSCTYSGNMNGVFIPKIAGVYCSGNTYSTNYGTRSDESIIPTYTTDPCETGYYQLAYIYGAIKIGPSYIVKSRLYNGPDANPSYFLSFATNSCKDFGVEHCILDDNGNCTGKYLYYKGPNLEKALVGPSSLDPNDSRLNGKSYLFTMSNARWDGEKYVCSGDAVGTGVTHLFFITIPPPDKLCPERCSLEGTNTSDNYLKCAENFCEARVDYDTKGNARKRKLNCLLNTCNYLYGHNPGEKNSESRDSCNQSQIVKDYGSSVIQNLTSRCNVTSDGKFVPEKKATLVESCIGDKVTDYDGVENDTIFDQRTYVNKICKETVNFGFKDTSVLSLTKGSGFTYPIEQEGDKTCTYFINLEQWKVDYASAPARDPEQRTRMLYLLDNFNSQVSSSSSDKGLYYRNSFDGEGYGTTGFENEGYDFSKTTISSKENETLANGEKVVTPNEMVVSKKSAMSNLESNSMNVINARDTKLGNKTDSRLSTITNEKVKIVENATIGEKEVNRYISNGTGGLTYSLKKVCISTDGLATIEPNPASDICFQTKEGNETKNVYSEGKYYTSFKIDKDVDQPISANVSVGKTGSSDTIKYYQAAENCTYKITDGGRCFILIETDENGKKLGNNQYEAESVKASIHYEDIDQSEIQKISIFDNNHETEAEEITVKNRNNRSMETHMIEGKIKLKDGRTIPCPNPIDLYTPETKLCDIGCNVVKIEDTIYEITPKGTTQPTNYYTYTSSHMTPGLDVLSQANSIPYEFMKPVYKSVTDGRRYIKLSEPLQEEEILFGYVTTGGDGKCNGYCYTNSKTDPDPKTKDCYKKYLPAQTKEIHDYCVKNWMKDINGFIDDEDCFNKCTVSSCQNNKNDLKVAEAYCANYHALGYPDYEHCLNSCYKEDEDEGNGDYIFRSVNVLDPFPNSQESQGIFEKGDRIIGKNWKFLSGYITNDEYDKTSVTGPFANTKVEYVIDMSPQDIRNLRKDTSENELNTEKNRRAVYAKLDRVKGNNNVIEEYRSQFIHNSDFTDLFQTEHGSIQASFNPRVN